jgi:hypothetical protein
MLMLSNSDPGHNRDNQQRTSNAQTRRQRPGVDIQSNANEEERGEETVEGSEGRIQLDRLRVPAEN